MTYQELCKDGVYIGEVDFYNNGIYAGTNKFYYYDNAIYQRREPTNAFSYDGETTTFVRVSDVKKAVKEYNREVYWEIEVFWTKEVSDRFFELLPSLGIEE